METCNNTGCTRNRHLLSKYCNPCIITRKKASSKRAEKLKNLLKNSSTLTLSSITSTTLTSSTALTLSSTASTTTTLTTSTTSTSTSTNSTATTLTTSTASASTSTGSTASALTSTGSTASASTSTEEIAKFQKKIVEIEANTRNIMSKLHVLQFCELKKEISEFQNEDLGFSAAEYSAMNWQDAMILAITTKNSHVIDNQLLIGGARVILPKTWQQDMKKYSGDISILTMSKNYTGCGCGYNNDHRRTIRDLQRIADRQKRLIALYIEKVQCLEQQKEPKRRRVN
jgi:hypothetical protein